MATRNPARRLAWTAREDGRAYTARYSAAKVCATMNTMSGYWHADAEWRNGGQVYRLLIGEYRSAAKARRGCERALRRLQDALFEDSLRRWENGDNIISRAARAAKRKGRR